jgi:hypothetical protein
MIDPMQATTWKRKIQSYQILKLHMSINYFAKNGRIEQGNFNRRVDSTGYICCIEYTVNGCLAKKSRFSAANARQLVIMNKRMGCNMQDSMNINTSY